MKTNLLFCISAFLNFSSIIHGMEQAQCIVHESSGIHYTKNNFGDIFPQWQDVPSEQLREKLSSFVNLLKDDIKEKPFIVVVPHEKAAALDAIKKSGFSLYHANNDKSEWIFKNGSSIPEPYNATLGAKVIIRKDDAVLAIEEKTRRGQFDFPVGGSEFFELLRKTAVRELKEEVNLTANPTDLTLVAITNRVNANRFHANDVTNWYIVDHSKVSGDLIPNPNEVVRAFYASLKDIAEKPEIDGLNVAPAVAAIAKHLLNKDSKTHHETFLDYRQLSKKDSERNQNDTMTVEFFAQ